MYDLIFHAKPKVYGVTYFLMIPVFGIIFYFIPKSIGEDSTLIMCLYFSAVTITTLGYGDIAPASDIGRILASSEAVLGVALIGLFLNALSRSRAESYRREEIRKKKDAYLEGQIAKLVGHYNLIHPLAEKYRQSVIQVTSPLEKRKDNYNPDFTLSDMRDLYRSSMLITQDYHEPAIKYYFSSLELLNNEISDLIKNVDLRLFPALENNSLEFVKSVHYFDFSDAILGAVKSRLGEKKMTVVVSEMLERYKGEVRSLESSLINGYISLYHQIKLLMRLIDSIEGEINDVIGD
ncbi:potassium channel family protein [Microbulbifer taiwanensis]|uniref:Potassium channel family protein n=1 Tax=Microbulbifer taiwanensis TaxID=986746 RepID=A0ABW1YG89_9GAMM|nr:potassium channel family protein [Microbulbifer taiwanensis]